MTALHKSAPPELETVFPPDKNPFFVTQANIIGNPFLLDDKNFNRYHRKITKYIDDKERKRRYVISLNVDKGIYTYLPQPSIAEYVEQLIQQNRLPHDYKRRLILRQMAQGIYIKPDILAEHYIVFTDGELTQAERRTPENRQPNSPYDFVLIEHSKWHSYSNMQAFYDSLESKPSCAFAKDGKNLIRPKDTAINLPYITPYYKKVGAMVFDIDDNGTLEDNFNIWREHNLPPPNIIIKNPTKNSYQYIYLLRDPVCDWGIVSQKIINYFDDIHKAINAKLNGDQRFNSDRMKNPFSRKHDTFVSGAEPYTLADLADKADLDCKEYDTTTDTPKRTKTPKIDPNGYLGRNCAIFDTIRHLGYSNAHLGYDALYFYLLSECEEYNRKYHASDPLPQKELHNIAKSIAKFCKSERFRSTPEQKAKRVLFARQNAIKANANGACIKGGKARSETFTPKRTQANAMHLQGVKIGDIATQLDISPRTLYNWGIRKK